MKHIFVINPKAGKTDKVKEISDEIKKRNDIDYEIYVTKKRGDAQQFVHNYLDTHSKDEVYRFYACGGDGTLYDVVNGMATFSNAEVACYAIGSGNDFVKSVGGIEKYKDLNKIIDGKSKPIDLLKVDDKYCINITNYGFDGEVTDAMLRYKKLPLVNGPMAYNIAALTSLLFKINQPLKVTVDDKVIFDKKGLLVIIANGFCYGGGFKCAPKALVDDGYIDLCLIDKVSRTRAAGLMKGFKKGEHLTDKKCSKLITYMKCKKVKVENTKKIAYAIDGEVFRKESIEAIILPKHINFVYAE